MTIREAARRLGVHENTVRRYADRGLLRSERLPSGIRRLRREDVERLAQHDQERPETEKHSWTLDEILAQPGKARTVGELIDRAPKDFWKSPEEMEEFVAWIYEQRKRDR